MRRARWILAWNVLALLSASMAFAAPQTVDFINGIGLIDYSSRPKIKAGAWVKYHVTGASQLGSKDDYDVTVLIPGEERFWGEDCFWVETWTEQKGKPPMAVATLVSYSVFTDSLPTIRSQYYMRKSVDGLTPDGSLQEVVVRRPPSTLKKRGPLSELPSVQLDSLETLTLQAAGKDFVCRKVAWHEGKRATLDQRDSTISTEVRENRMLYVSPQVPVTGLCREDIEHSIKRKTWAIGRSEEAAAFNVMDIAKGTATLVAYGEDGKSRLFPADRCHTLADFDAAGQLKVKRSTPAAEPKKSATATKKSKS